MPYVFPMFKMTQPQAFGPGWRTAWANGRQTDRLHRRERSLWPERNVVLIEDTAYQRRIVKRTHNRKGCRRRQRELIDDIYDMP